MKKKILLPFILSFLLITSLRSQISIDQTYNGTYFSIVKFSSAGYKYVVDDHTARTLKIFNTNNTLLTTINIPSQIPANYFVYNLSDNLFDLNNDFEYVVMTQASSSPSKVYVFKDNGTQMFFLDSAYFDSGNLNGNSVLNQVSIFNNGTGAKMKLGRFSTFPGSISKWTVYSLPGTIPCIQCSATGTTVGRPEYQNNNSEPVFYPNPANDQLKLKYELPKDYKTAYVKVQDMQGKEIETFRVTNDFNFIYLPKDYNNGLYIYSLIVDDKVIKREKIILSK